MFAGAVEDDAVLHHLVRDLGGEFDGVELQAEHEAAATHLFDGGVGLGESWRRVLK